MPAVLRNANPLKISYSLFGWQVSDTNVKAEEYRQIQAVDAAVP
jgi:hypothetical protein